MDPVTELEKMVARGTTKADIAREIGVTPQFIGQVMARDCAPGRKVLDFLGLEELIETTKTYRRKTAATS